ncbi:small multi-drug export protein [Sulfolobus acidocaldarius]|uniref:Ligand-binding protein SH3 n=4 Tax=Sulfolobus acidocaldarius TaxID=2285 RepID=Q4J9Z8_SULAC|nr:small multi-drug export protein [Sulfolobus acidocaldarius]AAY80376.1 hypothetical protein Saci_1019 [Sulfolobus acidocaldarius DSM 639]AGE70959.1 hypothetical protein SacN8_04940 [Sulfolobus acidocaldarius N8]AGE73230.1 hypothetical protein SacRon12I_04930 [Sulfolobus acidocaldarius Ron12/I]ALU28737.1 hypothetical protein ATY89_01365 [Sulfolobus acidocaldarius]ALU31456.1 hypothetical protein ATZ20_04400 [Sulfolobus acidocaldarius]
MELLKLLIVGLTAASPVGELLVAYPIGLAIGLDPLIAIITCSAFNLLPIPILLSFAEYISNRFPKFFNWIASKGKTYEKYIKSFGITIFLLLTPIIGVYATSIFMFLIGFKKRIAFLVQALSICIYSVILYLASLGFLSIRF